MQGYNKMFFKMTGYFTRIATIFVVLIFSQSCSSGALEKQTDEQVNYFRNHFATHEYAKIYEFCSDEFRKKNY